MPYLAGLDEFGNTASSPGPLLATTLIDSLVQQLKYWLSEQGLRYSLQLTPTIMLQPDLQLVWNPAFNPDAGPATVVLLQLNLAW